MVFFCGRDCQAKDWDNHKDKCKIIQKEYKLCQISYTIEDPTGKIHASMAMNPKEVEYKKEALRELLLDINSDSKKSHFVVKIEDPLGFMNSVVGAELPLFIQNKEKTFAGFIEKELNEEVYSEIIRVLKERGFKNSMAYFYAIVERTGTGNNNVVNVVKINLTRILPVETW